MINLLFLFACWNPPCFRSETEEQGDVDLMDVRGVILNAQYSDRECQSSAKMYLHVGQQKHRMTLSMSTSHPTVGKSIKKEF